MDKIWKWVMHLNAKAFCLTAVLLFFATGLWCGFKYLTPRAAFQDGTDSANQEVTPFPKLGLLEVVSNQLSSEMLTLPVDPFRPTMEAIFTNESERAAFLKALKAAQNAAAGLTGADLSAKKEDPFAHLRKKAAVPGQLTGPDGQPMVIPRLSFLGFVQRPDGTKAAAFHDSVKNTTIFYDSGNQVHGVDIMDANVRDATIRFPDGSTRSLEIGGTIELPAEPAPAVPAKKIVPAPAAKLGAGKKAAAAANKPVAANKAGAQAKAAQPAAKPAKPAAQAQRQQAQRQAP